MQLPFHSALVSVEVKWQWKNWEKRRISPFHRFTFLKLVLLPLIDFSDLQIYFPSKWRRYRYLYFEERRWRQWLQYDYCFCSWFRTKILQLDGCRRNPLSIPIWEFGIYYCLFVILKDKTSDLFLWKIFIRKGMIILKNPLSIKIQKLLIKCNIFRVYKAISIVSLIFDFLKSIKKKTIILLCLLLNLLLFRRKTHLIDAKISAGTITVRENLTIRTLRNWTHTS